jgi:cytochrome c553
MIRLGWLGAGVALLLSVNAQADCTTSREYASAMALRGNATAGAALFKNCIACHGSNADGARDGNVPAIAGQWFKVIVKQLVDFRHAERWDIRMERVADRHHLTNPQAIADVAKFVSVMPTSFELGQGNGNYLARGESVYRSRCAGCHGRRGEGRATGLIPRIAAQHQLYLVRQLQDAADGRRPNLACEHKALGGGLAYEDFQGVADYLSRLPARPR